jgi:hypothetical protein
LPSSAVKLLAGVVLVLFVLSCRPNAFAAVVDQKQEIVTGTIDLTSNSAIGQEFQPSLGLLEAVDVYLDTQNSAAATITLMVRAGTLTGTVLATATVSVPGNTQPGFVHFAFNSVGVTPGSTYVIQLVQVAGVIVRWHDSDANPYGKGEALVDNNVPLPSIDMAFRTYGSTPNSSPVGGEMLSVNPVQILGPWIAVVLALTAVAVQMLILRRWKHR